MQVPFELRRRMAEFSNASWTLGMELDAVELKGEKVRVSFE